MEDLYTTLPQRKRFRQVNENLLEMIQKSGEETFLLPMVVNYIAEINKAKILGDPYHINKFEFWLIHFSGLEDEEIRKVRGKIVGKYLPRDCYQVYFPIGGGKVFGGSHFIVSHFSPDVDTTIASFLSWMEAFACKVGTGEHVWNVPGGPPSSPTMGIVQERLGEECFNVLMQKQTILSLTAQDLLTQEGFIKSLGETPISSLDHGFSDKAIILINEAGHYLGDWRSSDVETTRQVIVSFKGALKFFENDFLIGLVRLFGLEKIDETILHDFYKKHFELKVSGDDLSETEREWMNKLLKEILKLPKGIDSSFEELFSALKIPEATLFLQETKSLLNGMPPKTEYFVLLEKIIKLLNGAIFRARDWIEKLKNALAIKEKVLGFNSHFLTLKSDLEEIKLKMKHYEYLTVVIPEGEHDFFPVGVVRANAIRNSPLGTVSLRDFCNLDEVKLPSYLSIISVIDHHKTDLKTAEPPLAVIGDTQSCNTLICELLFNLNDRFSSRGKTLEDIDKQILEENSLPIQSTLLKEKQAVLSRSPYFIHPQREELDYLLALYAILDDTDLLTKTTMRDVRCAAELLNRLYSLSEKKTAVLIDFSDIPQDAHTHKKAALKLLKHPQMYMFYQKTLTLMEDEIEKGLKQLEEGREAPLFNDTKEQNGCASITQIKLFTKNFEHFSKIVPSLQKKWVERCIKRHQEKNEIDLFILMVSTIPSAEELGGEKQIKNHQDELWIWIPNERTAEGKLASFLNRFQSAPRLNGISFTLELVNDSEKRLKGIFEKNFKSAKIIQREDKSHENGFSREIAILHYDPGLINSRKSMISPFLPKLVN